MINSRNKWGLVLLYIFSYQAAALEFDDLMGDGAKTSNQTIDTQASQYDDLLPERLNNNHSGYNIDSSDKRYDPSTTSVESKRMDSLLDNVDEGRKQVRYKKSRIV